MRAIVAQYYFLVLFYLILSFLGGDGGGGWEGLVFRLRITKRAELTTCLVGFGLLLFGTPLPSRSFALVLFLDGCLATGETKIN